MRSYTFEYLELDDVSHLTDFLSNHWKQDHIFCQSRKLLDWQHLDLHNKQFNFIVARDSNSRELLAILGFIPNQHFDPKLHSDYFLAIWKVRDDIEAPGLGLMLLKQFTKRYQPRFIGAIGLSQQVIPIYKALQYQVGQLAHHVFLNPAISSFCIGKVHAVDPSDTSLLAGHEEKLEISEASLDALQQLEPIDMSHVFGLSYPEKSIGYLIERYCNAPYFQYSIKSISQNNHVKGFLVYRKVSIGQSCVLRIVDFLGDETLLAGAMSKMLKVMQDEGAEYIDMYSFGLSEHRLLEAGFVNRHKTDWVIPNYFEPFLQKNIELDYAFLCKHNELPVRLFRGDSDQDRPNLMP